MIKVFKNKMKEEEAEANKRIGVAESSPLLMRPLHQPMLKVLGDLCSPLPTLVSDSSTSGVSSSDSSSCSFSREDRGGHNGSSPVLNHISNIQTNINNENKATACVETKKDDGTPNTRELLVEDSRANNESEEIRFSGEAFLPTKSMNRKHSNAVTERQEAQHERNVMNKSPTLHVNTDVVSYQDVPSLNARPVKKRKVTEELVGTNISKASRNVPSSVPWSADFLSLGQEQDKLVLNPLHTFIRNQIEVFAATEIELSQPAPGRKQPIKLHQVGLRCIHCRHLPVRKRVKRAVCYPSSVGRVYHSVSDMKFDHFSNCKEIPSDLRATFENLKAEGKKNKQSEKKTIKGKGTTASSTAQYYHDSAIKIGMVNGPGGIFLSSDRSKADSLLTASDTCLAAQECKVFQTNVVPNGLIFSIPQHLSCSRMLLLPSAAPYSELKLFNIAHFQGGASKRAGIMQSLPMDVISSSRSYSDAGNQDSAKQVVTEQETADHVAQAGNPPICISVRLASSEDSDNLNPLHCFVRRNVELFVADAADVSAPAPGRKTRVVLGQVGIRCIHCAKLSPKERVKRAVCYPPNVQGIYHSVSNMKFDHFAICPGLPQAERDEFTALKNSCGRRGTAGNNFSSSSRNASGQSTNGQSISSTAHYYHDSAVAKGLINTDSGIRFARAGGYKEAIARPSNEKFVKTKKPLSGKKRQIDGNTTDQKKQEAPHSSLKHPSSEHTGLSALMLAASQAT